MKVRDILEAPIDIYSVNAELDDAPTELGHTDRFSKTDIKVLKNKVNIKKMYDVFENIPYTFNLYFIDMKANLNIHNIGVYDKQSSLPDALIKAGLIENRPDAINIIYRSNFTNPHNYVPPTPWIIIHRLSHVFQIGGHKQKNDIEKLTRKMDMRIHNTLSKIIEDVYGMDNHREMNNPNEALSNIGSILANHIFTMRSARKKKLDNPMDYLGELLAQYLVSGSIKFNPLPKKIEGIDRAGDSFVVNKEWFEKYNNEILPNLAKSLEEDIEQLLSMLVGHYLVL